MEHTNIDWYKELQNRRPLKRKRGIRTFTAPDGTRYQLLNQCRSIRRVGTALNIATCRALKAWAEASYASPIPAKELLEWVQNYTKQKVSSRRLGRILNTFSPYKILYQPYHGGEYYYRFQHPEFVTRTANRLLRQWQNSAQ